MRQAILAALIALSGGLAVILPRPVTASRLWPLDTTSKARSPQERALAGGVMHLRSPASRLLLVRASTFLMGSTPTDVLDAAADCAKEPLGQACGDNVFANELAQHRVTLSAYWLDRVEVSVAEYRRCVELRRCDAPPFAEGGRRFDQPELPVSLVTFEDAERYCKFVEARLPTEAEFERAARGVEARRYPWGNLYNAYVANHGRFSLAPTDDRDGFEEAAPVGAFPQGRTPDGFLDLGGNVAEWVSDRYAIGYSEGDAIDPQGPTSPPAGSERVLRGGSYTSAGPWLRGAARISAEPATRRPFIGFRCARSAVRRPRAAE